MTKNKVIRQNLVHLRFHGEIYLYKRRVRPVTAPQNDRLAVIGRTRPITAPQNDRLAVTGRTRPVTAPQHDRRAVIGRTRRL